MLLNKLVRGVVVLVCVWGVSGCAKKPNPAPAQQEPTKTAAQYKAEAEKQINEQNASQELSRLEQEVAAEEANQP